MIVACSNYEGIKEIYLQTEFDKLKNIKIHYRLKN